MEYGAAWFLPLSHEGHCRKLRAAFAQEYALAGGGTHASSQGVRGYSGTTGPRH
jgi:hypothetical protein